MVKLGGKTSIVEFIFSKVVNQKSEAVTNMQPFVNVFLGILQNFLKLSKKEYLQGAASGVNIWIRTIIFTAKIVQTTTGISVIFIIRINVLQFHIFWQQKHSVISVCHCQWQQFFEFGLFYVHWDYDVITLLLIYWGYWLQSYHRGMKVPVSSSRFQQDTHGSHSCISLFNAPNNKLEYWLI